MGKKFFVVLSLFAIIFSSCQKESEIAEVKSKEVKQLEQKLGVQLKEATEQEMQEAIFIPYESLLASGDLPSFPPFQRYELKAEFEPPSYTYLKGYIASVTLAYEPLFLVDVNFSFRNISGNWELSFTNQLDMAYVSLYYMKQIFPPLKVDMEQNGMTSLGYYIKLKSYFRFMTTIGDKNYAFTAEMKFDITFPSTSLSQNGNVELRLTLTF